MSRFNSKSEVKATHLNLYGTPTYDRNSDKADLAALALSSFGTNVEKIQRAADKAPVEFVAKLAIWTRTVANLRSVSHVLANNVISRTAGRGVPYLRDMFDRIFVRPDDMTEVVALAQKTHPGLKLTNALRRAIKQSLESDKWTDWQIARYDGENKDVKLRDLVKLTHPRRDFKALIEGTMVRPTTTFESQRASGKSALQAMREMPGRLPVMATLKNLKAIIEDSSFSEADFVRICDSFENADAVRKSRILPLRIFQAMEAIKGFKVAPVYAKRWANAVNNLYSNSYWPFENYKNVVVVVDASGSMGSSGNAHKPIDVAKALAASASRNSTTRLVAFDSNVRNKGLVSSPYEALIALQSEGHGGATYANKVFESGLLEGADLVLFLTDMQLYTSGYSWGGSGDVKGTTKAFLQRNKNTNVVFWNLSCHVTARPVVKDSRAIEVMGYSDAFYSVLDRMLRDPMAVVNEIESSVTLVGEGFTPRVDTYVYSGKPISAPRKPTPIFSK